MLSVVSTRSLRAIATAVPTVKLLKRRSAQAQLHLHTLIRHSPDGRLYGEPLVHMDNNSKSYASRRLVCTFIRPTLPISCRLRDWSALSRCIRHTSIQRVGNT